jgi:hypothetical protein
MGVGGAMAIVEVVVALRGPECVFVGMLVCVLAVVSVGMHVTRAVGIDMPVAVLVFMRFAFDPGFAFAATASGAHFKSS